MSAVKTFRIPGENMAGVRAKIEKLAKRAARLKVAPVTLTVLSKEPQENEDGSVSTVYTVTVSGPAPMLAGWTLVGVINITDDGTILRYVPTVTTAGELAPYRDTKEHWCDHCRTRRYRLDTFIVRSEQGAYKQVGRNCLADFLGHQSPEAIIAGAESLMDAADICEEGEEFRGGIREREKVSLEGLLTQVAAEVRAHGWVSRGAARNDATLYASVDAALDMMEQNGKLGCRGVFGGPCANPKHHHLYPSDADALLADKAIEWARGLSYSQIERSEYLANLHVACKGEMVEVRQAGLAGSAISAYMREEARNAERRAAVKDATPMGEKGDKLTLILTCLSVQHLTTQYGESTLHKFSDAQGRRASWFASNEELVTGKTYRVRATVKAFNASYGETTLTRCACTEVLVDPEDAEHLALTASA